ncbi:MAG: site-specific DNA-methyltransferase [Chloroflexi bacterium]|nr:site-specific DNA-methyltransferase [Chloroflexota bacterium]
MAELIWEGKYDKDGKKVAPLRVALPFQTVETVNESSRERKLALDLFSSGRPAEWRNRLIWGDKKYVLPALLEEFAGKVDLIYIDPPFDTGADFSFQVQIEAEGFTKEPSIIEQKAYRDTWGRGLDSYLQWFYEAAVMLRELLDETGSIYVHLDWHVGQYAKVVLDEVFGSDNFRNEIARIKCNPKNYTARAFGGIHDTVFLYAKSGATTLSRPYISRTEREVEADYPLIERATGRHYNTVPLHAKGVRYGVTGEAWRGVLPPSGRHWAYIPETLDGFHAEGRIEWSETGNPRLKQYADEDTGKAAQDVWEFKDPGDRQALYATQKAQSLLERIVAASSDEGGLVLDCFVGSGTTAVVAEKLNRRWIACDLGRFAIHTTRKRLLGIPNVRPFVVQNLGKYERQLWQAAEFGQNAEATIQNYRRFILELYHAQPVSGYTWLHGVKAGRMVHVGAVDSPVSPGDVVQIATEFRRAVGTGKDAPKTNGVDVLGWDFAFELNEVARQQAAQANINMRFLRIPREVLEKKAVEQGDIRFFELAALSVDMQQKARAVTLTLTDFVIPPDDVPEDVQKAITHWEQWIDYWAVDWNNRGDTFHNEWQDYRTRKKRDLQKAASHTCESPGTYLIVVKVIDILGNDTTRTLKVTIV